jgi:ketosteroid isomerase-like protein
VIEEETAGRLDFRAFRHAVERRDADALLGFYSDDAELRIVNGDALEGPAFELRGRAEIQRYLQAVCDQEMTCTLEGGIAFGEMGVEFSEACEYQDGTRVLVRTTLELRGGRISRQLDVVERQS